MRRAAASDLARASPPSEAICFLRAADRRCARIRPPRRPSALAMSRRFTRTFYLTLSTVSKACPERFAASGFSRMGEVRASGLDPDHLASNVEERHADFSRQQLEIDPVCRHHCGAMTTGGERNQNVVLERVPFQQRWPAGAKRSAREQ